MSISLEKLEQLKKIKIYPITKAVLNSKGNFINKTEFIKYIINKKQYSEIRNEDNIISKKETEIKLQEKSIKSESKHTKISKTNSIKYKTNENKEKPKKKRGFFNYLKDSLIYLYENESNLKQYLAGDSFQKIPYQEPYSEEFFGLVKKGDIERISVELSNNKRLLFSFDYLGNTAYHWAAKLGLPDVLQVLINYGKHMNIKDKRGLRPIHWAVINNQYECAEVLVTNGAYCNVYDYEGNSPLHMAKDSKMINLIRNNINKKNNIMFKWKMTLNFILKSVKKHDKSHDD